MDIHEREMPWVKRVEKLIEALDGSSIGELELRETGTEIIIRRRPDMLLVSTPEQRSVSQKVSRNGAKHPAPAHEERGQAVKAPLTGVYYSAPSPTQPPFVNIGDLIQVGQVVALIEAMKVFNEIQSEIAGRVVALSAKNGDVVQKGSPLIKIEPL